MTAALRTDRLGKRYRPGAWGLRDCTLEIPAGHVIALVGPNGAGKSTLLHLVTGLLEPTTGTVEVFGSPAGAQTPAMLAEVGFVAQDHPLYRGFTVADLLHMGRSLNVRWDQRLAERRLAAVGVPLDRRAGQLSGGQQAQVALALALAKRPRLLVLDEPVASLDPLARREFMKVLMEAVAEDEVTVLLSSHAIAELERVCDWLVVVSGARPQLSGEVETLLAEHSLLTGPRTTATATATAAFDGVVQAQHSQRHSTLLVRQPADLPVHPGWQREPVGLEELILAYLENSGATSPGRTTMEVVS
ncbi:MAG: ABC transporter ATP-binding protein [Mycobacteriales bacterium]